MTSQIKVVIQEIIVVQVQTNQQLQLLQEVLQQYMQKKQYLLEIVGVQVANY